MPVNPKPVVLVYVTFPPSGEVRGGPRSMLMTARHLRRYRPVFVLGAENSFFDEVRAAGIEAHLLPTERLIDGFRNASWGEKARRLAGMTLHDRALLRIARETGAAVFHCQDVGETVTAGLAMRLSGRAVIWHVRDQSVNQRMWLFSLSAAIASRFVCLTPPLFEDYVSAAPAVLRPFLQRRVAVIPNGIDLQAGEGAPTREEARRQLGLEGSAHLLTVVGPLQPKKNQLALLQQAGAQLLALGSDIRIALVGSERQDPSYAAQVRATAEALGPGKVLFLGERPHTQMRSVYAASDVLLLPSQMEGLPRVALEARAAGCPVIASRNPGNAGAVSDGETGFLVEMNGLTAMADAVTKLRDPEVRARIVTEARRRVFSDFEVHAVTARVEELYDSCLSA